MYFFSFYSTGLKDKTMLTR